MEEMFKDYFENLVLGFEGIGMVLFEDKDQGGYVTYEVEGLDNWDIRKTLNYFDNIGDVVLYYEKCKAGYLYGC